MQQEVVEAQGHLIDSHVMEQIFDTVVEYSGRLEVEEFRIGRTNADGSYLRLKIETPQPSDMQQLLGQLLGLGCSPVDTGDAQLAVVERDCCAPDDFYSTTNHRTMVRHAGDWREVENQRMDAMILAGGGETPFRPPPALTRGGRGLYGLGPGRVNPRSQATKRPSL